MSFSYQLVINPQGDYILPNGQRYFGSFSDDSLSNRERVDLIESAQNTLEAYFRMHGKVAHKCISSLNGLEHPTIELIKEESETN